MPIHQTTHRVSFEEAISPYNNGQEYTAWRRKHFADSPRAIWFPEDEGGEVLPYQAFKIVTEVGGDHELESRFKKMK